MTRRLLRRLRFQQVEIQSLMGDDAESDEDDEEGKAGMMGMISSRM